MTSIHINHIPLCEPVKKVFPSPIPTDGKIDPDASDCSFPTKIAEKISKEMNKETPKGDAPSIPVGTDGDSTQNIVQDELVRLKHLPAYEHRKASRLLLKHERFTQEFVMRTAVEQKIATSINPRKRGNVGTVSKYLNAYNNSVWVKKTFDWLFFRFANRDPDQFLIFADKIH